MQQVRFLVYFSPHFRLRGDERCVFWAGHDLSGRKRLKSHVFRTLRQLSSLAGQLRSRADQLNSRADQLSSRAQQLISRAEQLKWTSSSSSGPQAAQVDLRQLKSTSARPTHQRLQERLQVAELAFCCSFSAFLAFATFLIFQGANL